MRMRASAVAVAFAAVLALGACSWIKRGSDSEAQNGSWVTTPHAEEDSDAVAAQEPARPSTVKPVEADSASAEASTAPVAESIPAPEEAPLATLPQEPAASNVPALAEAEDTPAPQSELSASPPPAAEPAAVVAEPATVAPEPLAEAAETPPPSASVDESAAAAPAPEPTGAQASAAAPPAAEATASQSTEVPQFVNFSISGKAHFPFRQSAPQSMLTPGRVRLDELATIVAQMKDGAISAIRVVGHSDRIGKAHRKELIAMRRAETVREYLVKRGVRAELIHALSKSDTQPIVFCEGERRTARLINCLAPNRRVDVIIEGPK